MAIHTPSLLHEPDTWKAVIETVMRTKETDREALIWLKNATLNDLYHVMDQVIKEQHERPRTT